MGSVAEVTWTVFQTMAPLLLTGATWVLAKAATWIDSNIKNSAVRWVLQRLNETVVQVVKELQQTLAEDAKAMSFDGKMSDADKLKLKTAAVSKTKMQLGQDGVRVLSKNLGLSDALIDDLIGTRVEAAVHDLKKDVRGLQAG